MIVLLGIMSSTLSDITTHIGVKEPSKKGNIYP